MPGINPTNGGLPPIQPDTAAAATSGVDSTGGATSSADATPPPAAQAATQAQQTRQPALAPPEPTTTQDLEQATANLYVADNAGAFNLGDVESLMVQDDQTEYEMAQQQRAAALKSQLADLTSQEHDQRKQGNDALAGALVMGALSIAAGLASGFGTIGAGGDSDVELSQGRVQMARWNSFGDSAKGFGSIGQAVAAKYQSGAQVAETADQKLATRDSDLHDNASQVMSKAESIRESVLSMMQQIESSVTQSANKIASNV